MSQATLSVTTLADPIQTFQQLGGQGLITNKALAIPVHLGGPWHSVEYVVLAPSTEAVSTSVGLHTQQTDEIYLVLAGVGCLTTNGQRAMVEAGALVIAPRGTEHSICNDSRTTPLAFLVVELVAPAAAQVCQPALKNLLALLAENAPWHAATKPLAVARIDLAPYLTAPWGELALVRLPPGGRVAEYTLEDADELLFVVNVKSGRATIVAGGHSFHSGMKGVGEFVAPEAEGLSAIIPAGMPRQISNRSTREGGDLLLLSLQVRRAAVTTPEVSQAAQEASV